MSTLNISKTVQGERVVWRRLLWVAPLAIAAASVTNLIVFRAAVALFPSVGEFPMLGTPQIVSFLKDRSRDFQLRTGARLGNLGYGISRAF